MARAHHRNGTRASPQGRAALAKRCSGAPCERFDEGLRNRWTGASRGPASRPSRAKQDRGAGGSWIDGFRFSFGGGGKPGWMHERQCGRDGGANGTETDATTARRHAPPLHGRFFVSSDKSMTGKPGADLRAPMPLPNRSQLPSRSEPRAGTRTSASSTILPTTISRPTRPIGSAPALGTTSKERSLPAISTSYTPAPVTRPVPGRHGDKIPGQCRAPCGRARYSHRLQRRRLVMAGSTCDRLDLRLASLLCPGGYTERARPMANPTHLTRPGTRHTPTPDATTTARAEAPAHLLLRPTPD